MSSLILRSDLVDGQQPASAPERRQFLKGNSIVHASPMQLLVVGVIIVLLFGGRRIGEVGRGLGKGLRNFRQALENPEPPSAPESATQEGPSKPTV